MPSTLLRCKIPTLFQCAAPSTPHRCECLEIFDIFFGIAAVAAKIEVVAAVYCVNYTQFTVKI